jgi:hypothetical protein
MTAKKVDANQRKIVTELRKMGMSVMVMSNLGHGKPDICVGCVISGRPTNLLFEIKDGSKPPSFRKLTPHEEKFFETWNGQVNIVYSVEDVLTFMRWEITSV